jgi:hypothetical protein
VNPREQTEKILSELQYDFRVFTIDHFIRWIEQKKGRQIFSNPLKLPAGLYGAWFTDDEEPNEYIFYRENVPPIYQIHNQLHELAHFLLGHPTIHINREILAAVLSGVRELPFNEYALLRSTEKSIDEKYIREIESETLASVIQEQVIRHSQLEQLTHGISSDKNIANYLQHLGMI